MNAVFIESFRVLGFHSIRIYSSCSVQVFIFLPCIYSKKYCPVCVLSVKVSFLVIRKRFSYCRKVREAGINVREKLPALPYFSSKQEENVMHRFILIYLIFEYGYLVLTYVTSCLIIGMHTVFVPRAYQVMHVPLHS